MTASESMTLSTKTGKGHKSKVKKKKSILAASDPLELREIRKARDAFEIAEIDYKRAIKNGIAKKKYTQASLGMKIGISQPSVSSLLKNAKGVVDPPEGFSGASPFEICQRYSIGKISKESLIDQLSRWKYAKPSKTDGFDDLLVDGPGTFYEVDRAVHYGIIEDDVYDELLGLLSKKSE